MEKLERDLRHYKLELEKEKNQSTRILILEQIKQVETAILIASEEMCVNSNKNLKLKNDQKCN